MANPLFKSLGGNNGFLNGIFGGKQQFQNMLNGYISQYKQNNNISPQEKVQQLLNSGQMTQEQFERFRTIANQLTGKNL